MRIRNQSPRDRILAATLAASRRTQEERLFKGAAAMRSTIEAFGKSADATEIYAAGQGVFVITDDAGGAADGAQLADPIADDIFDIARAHSTLLSRLTLLTIDRNKAIVTTSEDATAGIQFHYLDTEAEAAIPQSKTRFGLRRVALSTVAAIVPVTDELLDDSPAAFTFNLKRMAGIGLATTLDDKVLNGLGAGRILGMYCAPSLIVQAAEGGQTSDTINATNVAKMDARCSADSLANRVVICHPDARSQFLALGAAIYSPGDATAPAGRLCGAPILPNEAAPALGDLGDILFADPSQYLLVMREGGVRESVSIHMWFDRDLAAFKFTIRVDGFPLPAGPVPSLNNPSVTRSPFVCLAAR